MPRLLHADKVAPGRQLGKVPPHEGTSKTEGFAVILKQHEAKWDRERLKAALDIECSPIEAGFSKELVELMAEEERAVSEDGSIALFTKIDDMVTTETKNYFDKQCKANIAKWKSLYARQAQESIQLHDDFKACRRVDELKQEDAPASSEDEDDDLGVPEVSPVVTTGKTSMIKFKKRDGRTPVLSLDARLEQEEKRLRILAAEGWRENQTYDVVQAFDLQLARIDAEWDAYELALRADYDHQVEVIQAQDQKKRQRWRPKEKQARLIHTAPVFEPDANAIKPKIADSETMTQKRQTSLKLDFDKALQRVEVQRDTAKKWINRQAKRMRAQIDAMAPVSTFVAAEDKVHHDARTVLATLAADLDKNDAPQPPPQPVASPLLLTAAKTWSFLMTPHSATTWSRTSTATTGKRSTLIRK